MSTNEASLLAELRSYVGFTDGHASLLSRFRPLAEPHFKGIADEFYAVARMHEGAYAVFKDEAQTRRLHESLKVWLGELLGGPYDTQYVVRRSRIGEVHTRIGLEPRYVIAAMGRIRASLQHIASGAFPGDAEAERETVSAIDRVCDIDLAIILESYKNRLVGDVEQARAREHEAIRAPLDERGRVFADALEAADVAVLCFGPSLRFLLANRKAQRMTGCTSLELAEGDLPAKLFGARADEVRARWAEAASGTPTTVEAQLQTGGGPGPTVRWHAAAHEGAAGEGASLVVVGVDVTHERELEHTGRRAERQAAAGTLAAGLAHEIRNPLNGANLHVAVLERALARNTTVPPSAREAMAVLRREIVRMSALVTDFLEVARPRTPSRVECDANELAHAVTAQLAPEAEARGAKLGVEPFPFPATARLDADRARQALLNLVRNALDAVKPGGTVTVRVRRVPRGIEIDVVDDGAGIQDPKAPVFDAFYTTKSQGTGLGLSIVQRVVTDHGGDVTFESRPGHTVFTVRLPADPAHPPA
jgi:signal transduction histidine kinase